MNLYTYLEEKLPLILAKEFLKKIFPGANISGELGIRASDIFKLKSFNSDMIISMIKKNKDVLDVIYIPRDQRKKYLDMPTTIADSGAQTFLIKTKSGNTLYFKDTSQFSKDENSAPSILSEKELSPASLGFTDKKIKREVLILKCKSLGLQKPINDIIQLIIKYIQTKRDNSSNVTFQIPGLQNLLSKISKVDNSKIFKDFGEVFSAIVSSGTGDLIFFPKESNYGLIDFIIERNKTGKLKSFSAKFGGGAKASIVSLIDAMRKNKKILDDDSSEKNVFDVLNIINSETAADAAKILIEKFKLEKKLKTRIDNFFIDNKVKNKDELKKDYKFMTYIRTKEIVSFLNNDKEFTKTFSILINAAFNIDQIVIHEVNGDAIEFTYHDFKDSSFKFGEKNTSKDIKGKIGFSLIQKK